MSHGIEIVEVSLAQKSIIRQLIELYEYDFSEYNEADLNEYGYYGYLYLDHYWTEEGRHPYFIKVNGHYAGFVLVNSFCYASKEKDSKAISEFFVMRKYRGRGVGKQAAKLVFDKFDAHWEVLQHPNNVPSQHFWRRVVEEYTNGQFVLQEVRTKHWKGQGYFFRSPCNQIHIEG